jgi:hypothetical protein
VADLLGTVVTHFENVTRQPRDGKEHQAVRWGTVIPCVRQVIGGLELVRGDAPI